MRHLLLAGAAALAFVVGPMAAQATDAMDDQVAVIKDGKLELR